MTKYNRVINIYNYFRHYNSGVQYFSWPAAFYSPESLLSVYLVLQKSWNGPRQREIKKLPKITMRWQALQRSTKSFSNTELKKLVMYLTYFVLEFFFITNIILFVTHELYLLLQKSYIKPLKMSWQLHISTSPGSVLVILII